MRTKGRGAYEITFDVERVARAAAVEAGVCSLFIRHTSASLMICENADPQVLQDLEAFLARLIPDGDRLFRHTAEGADDMPAHVRSVLTQQSIIIPINKGRMMLGTWQGIYLYEHRRAPHAREITVTIQGE
ncbi:MAG: secondary thiamine-phosphate synthase enzyme YjbQ [Chromatiales bacterium]